MFITATVAVMFGPGQVSKKKSKIGRTIKLGKEEENRWTEAGFPLCGSEETSNRHRRSVGGLEMRSILAALLPEGEDRPQIGGSAMLEAGGGGIVLSVVVWNSQLLLSDLQ